MNDVILAPRSFTLGLIQDKTSMKKITINLLALANVRRLREWRQRAELPMIGKYAETPNHFQQRYFTIPQRKAVLIELGWLCQAGKAQVMQLVEIAFAIGRRRPGVAGCRRLHGVRPRDRGHGRGPNARVLV